MRRHLIVAFSLVLLSAQTAWAQQHTSGVPQLSSRPGAAYTIYLDPAGFDFFGMWLGETPGNNLAIFGLGPNDTFNADQQTAISAIWASMANQFRCFDVNVTTVDPAIAAGQAASDFERQNYYDSQARMMHTIIGPPGNKGWQGEADGLAGLDVIAMVQTGGLHTNWMFSQDVDFGSPVANGTYIGSISAHEGGHTFGLQHQGDFMGGTQVNEYGFGDAMSGSGSYVATMGNASGRQRVAWRVGTAHDDNSMPFSQNDVQVIRDNDGMTFVDSGHGHTFAAAQPLPINMSGNVDVSTDEHRGCISPIDSGGFDPFGGYTSDFFTFTTDGSQSIQLTANDGTDLLVPGMADNGATLRAVMTIYDAGMNPVGSGTEDASTLFTTYSAMPAAGSYFVEVAASGGRMEMSMFDVSSYYDMGGYFLTGSGFTAMTPLLGDVNCDGMVSLLDVSPFVDLITTGEYLDKADINQDSFVNLLDVSPFVALLIP